MWAPRVMFRAASLAAAVVVAALWVSAPEKAGARESEFPNLVSISLEAPQPAPESRILDRAGEELAQAPASQDAVIRQIEKRGYSKVTGLMRRGQNYVFQAVDPYGDRVRVVMNAQTGEIVGLSRIVPRKK